MLKEEQALGDFSPPKGANITESHYKKALHTEDIDCSRISAQRQNVLPAEPRDALVMPIKRGEKFYHNLGQADMGFSLTCSPSALLTVCHLIAFRIEV